LLFGEADFILTTTPPIKLILSFFIRQIKLKEV